MFLPSLSLCCTIQEIILRIDDSEAACGELFTMEGVWHVFCPKQMFTAERLVFWSDHI